MRLKAYKLVNNHHQPMMKTIMKLKELKSIEQLSQFLDGTQSVIFRLDTVKKNVTSGSSMSWFVLIT